MDKRMHMDGRTDGQRENSIPPPPTTKSLQGV